MNPNYGNAWQPGMQPFYGDPSMPFMGPNFRGNQHPVQRGPVWGPNQPPTHQHAYNSYQRRGTYNPIARNHFSNSPGPSRASTSSSHGHGSHGSRDLCFICRDALQNCNERGIHLCDGGHGHTCDNCSKEAQKEAELIQDLSQEEVDAKLESLLQEIKGCIQNKYQSVSETLEQFVTNRINEINTIHKSVTDDQAALESLKIQLETRTEELEKREQKLREKEKQQQKDRQKFDKELQKEKEEICRQWQQLRDEVTRMEDMHKVQEDLKFIYHYTKIT